MSRFPMSLVRLFSTAVLIAAAACTKAKPPEPKAVTVPAATAPAETPQAAALPQPSADASAAAATETAPPEVKLLEPGAEPRKRLRYKLTAIRPEVAQMDMTMAMSIESAGKKADVQLPTMRIAFEMRPTEATAERLRYDIKFVSTGVLNDAKMERAMIERLRSAIAPMSGITGWAEVDERGGTRRAELDIPDTVPPEIRQTMDGFRSSISQLSSPLPEEDVGKGAKWQVNTALSKPLVLSQTAQFTLKEMTKDGVVLGVVLSQTAQQQPLPGPAGVKVDLVSLKGQGTGQMKVNLSRLAPETSTDLTSVVATNATVQGSAVPGTASSRIKMVIRPRGAAKATP